MLGYFEDSTYWVLAVHGQHGGAEQGLRHRSLPFLIPTSAQSSIHLNLLHKDWTGCRKVGEAHLTVGIRLLSSWSFTNVTCHMEHMLPSD